MINRSEIYFNTLVVINACADEQLVEGAFALCAKLEKALSKYAKGSDIYRLNHARGNPVRLGLDAAAVLRVALEVARASKGAFNPALSQVCSLWDFQAAKPELPDPEAIRKAVGRSDFENIELYGDVARMPCGMCFEPGGVAKGIIGAALRDYLVDEGVKHAFLNLGGHVVAWGGRPDGHPWRIGLQRPETPRGQGNWAYIDCADGVITTSGVYERGFTIDGRRYHHLLDPATGYPVENGVIAVSLFGTDAKYSDAVSTACFVMGPEHGAVLARSFGFKVVYLMTDKRIVSDQELDIHIIQEDL